MAKYTYRILDREIMAKGWSSLSRMKVEAAAADGEKLTLLREVAYHGDGAAVLPVDPERQTVLLVRQWRAGVAYSGEDPFLIEACAGLLDEDDPPGCVAREALEELGTRISDISHVTDCYPSPGALAEKVSLFMARYSLDDRISSGGGLAREHEDIEVLELPLKEAYGMIAAGKIRDAKTIILLQHAMLAR